MAAKKKTEHSSYMTRALQNKTLASWQRWDFCNKDAKKQNNKEKSQRTFAFVQKMKTFWEILAFWKLESEIEFVNKLKPE